MASGGVGGSWPVMEPAGAGPAGKRGRAGMLSEDPRTGNAPRNNARRTRPISFGTSIFVGQAFQPDNAIFVGRAFQPDNAGQCGQLMV